MSGIEKGHALFVPADELKPGEPLEYEYDPRCSYVDFSQPDPVSTRMRPPQTMDPDSVANKILGIRYGSLESQVLDLYYPAEGEGPFPLILNVHGGGWMFGSRQDVGVAGLVDCALSHGIAVAAVDYRLAPKAKFPENLYDVKTAVRWARANAAQYRLDPERFGVIGDSAGGHFSLMIAATANVPALEGEAYGWPGVSSAVQAACAFYPPVDMERDWSEFYAASGAKRIPLKVKGHSTMEEYEFGSVSAPNLAPLVSPHRYVHKDMPPVLLFHGMSDGVVPYQHSELMTERIREVCGEGRTKLLLYPERVHSDMDFMTGESAQIAVVFFDRVFRGEAPFEA